MHTGQLLWDVSWMHLCCLSRGRQRPHVSQCWNLSRPPTLRRWHYDTLTYSPHCHGSVLGVLQECDRGLQSSLSPVSWAHHSPARTARPGHYTTPDTISRLVHNTPGADLYIALCVNNTQYVTCRCHSHRNETGPCLHHRTICRCHRSTPTRTLSRTRPPRSWPPPPASCRRSHTPPPPPSSCPRCGLSLRHRDKTWRL